MTFWGRPADQEFHFEAKSVKVRTGLPPIARGLFALLQFIQQCYLESVEYYSTVAKIVLNTYYVWLPQWKWEALGHQIYFQDTK